MWYLYQGDPANIPGDSWLTVEDCVPVVVSPDKETVYCLAKECGVKVPSSFLITKADLQQEKRLSVMENN